MNEREVIGGGERTGFSRRRVRFDCILPDITRRRFREGQISKRNSMKLGYRPSFVDKAARRSLSKP